MTEYSHRKILIVDDEPMICSLLMRMIEPLKHDVTTASNGLEGYRLCQTEKFDLVISDIKMPRMDGMELLRKLREDKIDCAFIILTAFGDLGEALAARAQYNIYNYLLKPITHPDQFLFEIESAISRHELEQENRKLVEALRRSNEDLEVKVKDRTHELETKNEALNMLSNFRADVLRVLGHELRTPLGLVSGYLTLLQQEGAQPPAAYAQKIRSSTDRLQSIVDHAMANLRVDDVSEFRLDRSDVEPNSLCQDVVNRITPLIVSRNLRLSLSPLENDSSCHWDHGNIEMVVEELIVNAIRFTPDGGSVRIALEHRDAAVSIAVEDTGVGIPQGELDRIFEPFVTLGSPNHHSSGRFDFGAQGIGLGLSTACMWVQLHGGTLQAAANESHQGSVFTVTLPVS